VASLSLAPRLLFSSRFTAPEYWELFLCFKEVLFSAFFLARIEEGRDQMLDPLQTRAC